MIQELRTMAVTINDFEIMPSSTPTAQSTAFESTDNAAEALSAEELNVLIRRELERQARVWAH